MMIGFLAELIDNALDHRDTEKDVCRVVIEVQSSTFSIEDNGTGVADFQKFWEIGGDPKGASHTGIGYYGWGGKHALYSLAGTGPNSQVKVTTIHNNVYGTSRMPVGKLISSCSEIESIEGAERRSERPSYTRIEVTGGKRVSFMKSKQREMVFALGKMYWKAIADGDLEILFNGDKVHAVDIGYVDGKFSEEHLAFISRGVTYKALFTYGRVTGDYANTERNGATIRLAFCGRYINFDDPMSFLDGPLPSTVGGCIELLDVTSANGGVGRWPLNKDKTVLEDWAYEELCRLVGECKEFLAIVAKARSESMRASTCSLTMKLNELAEEHAGVTMGNGSAEGEGDELIYPERERGGGGAIKNPGTKKPWQQSGVGGKPEGNDNRPRAGKLKILLSEDESPESAIRRIDPRQNMVIVNMKKPGARAMYSVNDSHPPCMQSERTRMIFHQLLEFYQAYHEPVGIRYTAQKRMEIANKELEAYLKNEEKRSKE